MLLCLFTILTTLQANDTNSFETHAGFDLLTQNSRWSVGLMAEPFENVGTPQDCANQCAQVPNAVAFQVGRKANAEKCWCSVTADSPKGANLWTTYTLTGETYPAFRATDNLPYSDFSLISKNTGFLWGVEGNFGDVFPNVQDAQTCANICGQDPRSVGFELGEGPQRGNCVCAQGLTAATQANSWNTYKLNTIIIDSLTEESVSEASSGFSQTNALLAFAASMFFVGFCILLTVICRSFTPTTPDETKDVETPKPTTTNEIVKETTVEATSTKVINVVQEPDESPRVSAVPEGQTMRTMESWWQTVDISTESPTNVASADELPALIQPGARHDPIVQLMLDMNLDGNDMDFALLLCALESLHISVSSEDLSIIFAELDPENLGVIDFPNFLEYIREAVGSHALQTIHLGRSIRRAAQLLQQN